MSDPTGPRARTAFELTWLGQLIFGLGSGLTTYALGIWIYLTTESATAFGLIVFCAAVPRAVIAPRARALLERWNLRGVLILSAAGAGIATAATAILIRCESVPIGALCLAVGAIAVARAFQLPAFDAATPLLVSAKRVGRASVMNDAGTAAAEILAPLTAALLLVTMGLPGVLLIAVATFLLAVVSLLPARIPRPLPAAAPDRGRARLGIPAAWSYLRRHRGLLALLVLVAGLNFAIGMLQVVLTPLILGFAGVPALGAVLAVAVTGLACGEALMSTWDGPRRRINAIFVTLTVQGMLLLGFGWRQSAALVAAAAFFVLLGKAFVIGCSLGIWQRKLAPDVEPTVTALRRSVILLSLPLGNLLAGPLVEYVFEPLLAPGGPLAESAGPFIGVGPGRGSGLLLITLGCCILVAVLLGHLYPRLRNLETESSDAGDEENE